MICDPLNFVTVMATSTPLNFAPPCHSKWLQVHVPPKIHPQSESLVLYTYVLVGGAQRSTVVIVCGRVYRHLDLGNR